MTAHSGIRKIRVTSGTGIGDTKLAAFDAALFSAGIANYNLIYLSSIIPEGFEPVTEKLSGNGSEEFGHKLYVVMASQKEDEVEKEAWAGIGWVMTEGEKRKGLFVEHTGADKHQVVNQIKKSLDNMTAYREGKFGEIQYEVIGITCHGKPVCAVVAAVYQSEGWG